MTIDLLFTEFSRLIKKYFFGLVVHKIILKEIAKMW